MPDKYSFCEIDTSYYVMFKIKQTNEQVIQQAENGAQIMECLPSIHKALASVPNTS